MPLPGLLLILCDDWEQLILKGGVFVKTVSGRFATRSFRYAVKYENVIISRS